MEQVRGDSGVRQHPLYRRGVDAAQVGADDLDRVPSRRGDAGQAVRGVICGAALRLPRQPLLAGQVNEAGMPPVREQDVLPGLPVGGKPRPAAAVLIDPQVRHNGGRLVQQRIRRGRERVVRHRPGDPGVPGRPPSG